MSRRRADGTDDNSLDLLLDTVSNVFGGVMFLTLLAALLILTRGAKAVSQPEVEPPELVDPIDPRWVRIEMRQVSSAVQAQQKMLNRLDPDGRLAEKAERLESLERTVDVAKRQVRRTGAQVADRQQKLEDQQIALSDLDAQIEELQEAVAEKSRTVNRIRADSERTVEFRPLSLSLAMEAVVILRYGRWYLLYESARGELNRDDFFVLPSNYDSFTAVTPKPHRGHIVTEQSLDELAEKLKQRFPVRQFHITIAVWDDSFAEFNPLKDTLKAAGYRYRTLTCDSTTSLTNQAAVDSFVQ